MSLNTLILYSFKFSSTMHVSEQHNLKHFHEALVCCNFIKLLVCSITKYTEVSNGGASAYLYESSAYIVIFITVSEQYNVEI